MSWYFWLDGMGPPKGIRHSLRDMAEGAFNGNFWGGQGKDSVHRLEEATVFWWSFIIPYLRVGSCRRTYLDNQLYIILLLHFDLDGLMVDGPKVRCANGVVGCRSGRP